MSTLWRRHPVPLQDCVSADFYNSSTQERSNGGVGVYRYIYPYPPKLVYLTNFYVVTGCCFFFDPGQIVVDFEIVMTS